MDGTNPKISFIPKGSLVRETAFLERRRPRSVAGLLAIFTLVVSIGAYAGFYFYNSSFESDIVSMRDKINATQQTFSNAPQVEEAQLFSSRASVARELLDGHTVVSPTFKFLSDNTISSILYDKFSFVSKTDGSKVELTGEAPTYAALAYQADVLRNKKELLNFAVTNVSLTKLGTVSFALALTFTPSYLSYTRSLNSVESTPAAEVTPPQSSLPTPGVASETPPVSAPASTSTFQQGVGNLPVSSTTASGDVGSVAPVLIQEATTTNVATTQIEKPSFLQSLWSKAKFW